MKKIIVAIIFLIGNSFYLNGSIGMATENESRNDDYVLVLQGEKFKLTDKETLERADETLKSARKGKLTGSFVARITPKKNEQTLENILHVYVTPPKDAFNADHASIIDSLRDKNIPLLKGNISIYKDGKIIQNYSVLPHEIMEEGSAYIRLGIESIEILPKIYIHKSIIDFADVEVYFLEDEVDAFDSIIFTSPTIGHHKYKDIKL